MIQRNSSSMMHHWYEKRKKKGLVIPYSPFDIVKFLHWLSILIIYTNKQNRKEKRDSPYPLFPIRYNRRFIKFHIIASIVRHWSKKKIQDPKEERFPGILYSPPQFEWINVVKFLRWDSTNTPCTIGATNEMFKKKKERKKRKEDSRYLIPLLCYQTSNAVDRGH